MGAYQPPESIWQNRNFRVLLSSAVLLGFGGRVYELALPLIIYELTQSSVAMGTMRAIEFLPNLLLAMFVGVFVDRADKKRWMLTVVALQTALLFALYFLIRLDLAGLEVFYVAGFFLMLFQYAYGNAKISTLKLALPREMLTSANAKFTFIDTFMQVMGPAISGMILFLASLYYGLLITGFVYLVALLMLRRLRLPALANGRPQHNLRKELADGWHELRRNRPMWVITWFVVFFNSTAGVFEVMVIFFLKDELAWSTALVGAVLACAGAGGLLATLVIQPLRRAIGLGRTMALTIAGLAVVYALIPLNHAVWMVVTTMFLFGFAVTLQSVLIWSYRHETTPAPLIGRVSGITGSIFKLGMPFAIFGSGLLTAVAGASTAFAICAVVQILVLGPFLCSCVMKER
jgi:Na+/melibiose symporter-like transporter